MAILDRAMVFSRDPKKANAVFKGKPMVAVRLRDKRIACSIASCSDEQLFQVEAVAHRVSKAEGSRSLAHK